MSNESESHSRGRRTTTVLILGGVLLALVLGLPSLASLYTDAQWFGTLGRSDVFSTILWTRLGLGLGVGLVVALVLEANLWLARRISRGLPTLQVADPNMAPIDLGESGPKLLRFSSPVIGLFAGLAASNQWSTWLRFTHGSTFGRSDPIFDRDIGFYVFDVPLYDAVHTLGTWVVVLGLLLAGGTYVLRGGLVFDGRRLQMNRGARAHLSVLIALLFLLLGFSTWLATVELLYSDNGPVDGASYTDVNARLPMLRVEIGIAVLGAILVLISITRQRLVLIAVAVALFLGVELLGVQLYPSLVQRFSVEPNEADKEAPYIDHNIQASQAAYGLDEVKKRDLSANVKLTKEDLDENRTTIENIRVWDHKQLLDTFAQIQEIRTYYEFVSVDNDRYSIDGEYRQVMLSPRELSVQSLPNRTWINERFTFTHGYGLTLGPVNKATQEGLPELYVKDMPPKTSVQSIDVTRPGIYFGELSNNYVFVHSEAKEFDHPSGDKNIFKKYQGGAGVELDSAWDRLAVALRVGSVKLLLSENLKSDTRILLNRKIRDRVRELAPFLELDGDPYMVVRDNGELVWIQDAYTTTDRYPYAEPARRNLNYIRNSVKVVLDAYEGTVDFYTADAEDPILKTWKGVFPGMFQPLDKMPDDIRRHLRHPEELFRIQTQMFTVYHMDSPELVYNREDQWEIPAVSTGQRSDQLQPYYTIMRLPGYDEPEFIFMLPFTPKNKENLAAWMVARNDGDELGELVVYRFPRDRLVFGPSQIMNRISQNAEISRQVSLWDQRGSQVQYGNLLVIPIEEALIYVVPLYLRSSGGRIPELKRVIVAYRNDIAMEPTLDEALTTVVTKANQDEAAEEKAAEQKAAADQAAKEKAAADQAKQAAAAEGTKPGPEQADRKAAPEPERAADGLPRDPRLRAHELYERAVEAQRQGDWAGYGQRLEQLRGVLEELAKGAKSQGSSEGSPSGTGQPSRSDQPAGASKAPAPSP